MIATVIRDKFAAYYNTFIPGLKSLLKNTPMTTPKQKELRANTIKTIGNMLYAVGEIKENREVVVADAKLFVNELIMLLDSKLSDDDPQIDSIYSFFGEVSNILGEAYSEYLPKLVPTLQHYAKQSIDVKITDAENPAAPSNSSGTMSVSIAGINLSLNTHAFQLKLMGLSTLLEICSNTKRAFYPYAEEMAKIVETNLDAAAPGSLKREASKFISPLIMTCDTKENMIKMFNYLYPPLRKVLLVEISKDVHRDVKTFFKELCNALRHFTNGPQPLSMEGLTDLVELLVKGLECYKKLHDDKIKALSKSKKLDEEEIDEINEIIDKNAKIVTHIMEICGIIAKLYGMQLEPLFVSKIIPYYANFWQNAGKSSVLELACICFFCDYIEYMKSSSMHSTIARQVGQKFVEAMSKDDRDIIQSAGYGLGLIAEHAPADFKAILVPAVQSLAVIVKDPESRNEDNATSTECAIGALGKIGFFHYNGELVGPAFIKEYLSLLPLKAESEEAQNVHKLLFTQIIAHNPALTGCIEETKAALERIHLTNTNEPSLEIVKTEDLPLLQQAAQILSTGK